MWKRGGGERDRKRDQQRLRELQRVKCKESVIRGGRKPDRQIPLSVELMRRNSEPVEDRKKGASLSPVGRLFDITVMDLLPTLASTVFASTVSRLRESTAVQSINRRLSRRTMSSPEVCWPVPMRAIGAQNLLTMPGGVSTAGYLHKKGGSQFSLMKWPLRYTILHKGCVYYFKSSTSPAPQGAFSLNGYNRVMRAAEETTSSNVFPFKIVHFSKKHRTWFFSAASEDERRKWMRYLRREIDHYNDRKEFIPSDSDSDADSFYGTIERPMDIKHPIDNTEVDYVEDDDDDDEEDYVKPDSECSPTSTGRPTGPPPSYPPPPVPATFRQDSSPGFHKGVPPPVPPQNRIPTSALPKKPPPSVPPPSILKDLSKGPPPPIPFAPHLHKSFSSNPPPPPPPNVKKPLQSRTTSMGGPWSDGRERRNLPAVSIQSPATLPICNQLETRMVLNGPAHCPLNTGGSQSLGNNQHGGLGNLRSKPSLPIPHSANIGGTHLRPVMSLNQTSMPGPPPLSPLLKTGLHNKPGIPKPPLPTVKPQLPAAKSKQPGTPLQRASPDGQSFRSLGDETPTDFRRKRDSGKHTVGDESDEDYENVQLPDSVFIDTTETSFVEKLFRESPIPPQDGLYGIRNSGTKTSQVLVVWDVSIGKARNYRLFEEEDHIFLDIEVSFPTLSALIEHYYSHPLPHHGSLCLQKPFTKTMSI
ncbi:SH3 domain-binding protein 2 isoform X3 [Dicentrarchus labrax]|uniref:SH3 domain-binding protein 2 isoform X3 n=1 Tax=Dicentrarchus labrax TaxID=13489 RepID=UPI0021F64E86|nr:SH3 domain-binding protein 2 isoform X3 [Dicentrarchus labrax]